MLPRIRTIKPEFFRHWELFRAERDTGLPLRVAYAGLWTCCDREGRFPWRPEELKVVILPHDSVDFSRVLDALTTRGFVQRYTCENTDYGCVPTFKRHQVVNNKERDSMLPAAPATPCLAATSTRAPREDDATTTRDPRVPDACHTGTGTGTGTEPDREAQPQTSSETEEREFGVGELRALWNDHAKRNDWPGWNEGARKRERMARSILGSGPSRPRWVAALERASRSSFLRGRTPRNGAHENWRPTPDWLLKPDTLRKIEEGLYDDREGADPAAGIVVRDEHGIEIA